jgi:immune inhibitor A
MRWLAAVTASGLAVGAVALGGAPTQAAQAAPPQNPGAEKANQVDSLPSPLADKQQRDRTRGLERVIAGKAKPHGPNKVVKLAKRHYVELAREGEDSIWTVLGQFGDQVNPTYGGTAGPGVNEIPEPDRSVDNTTIWNSDFSQAYYEKLLFSEKPRDVSMRNFYIEQSSNRYTVNGEVTDWVTVPYNAANYGANYCNDIVCARTWLFVRDSVNAWYDEQIASGRSKQYIEADLAKFDVWDRYDYDGDGNFNEPDGYIDHFQSVHAGEGEETGGGAQGTDAIWSHRWYAFQGDAGKTGPAFNKLGGIKVGDTDLWIGDYTIEPENGGVGVFAHEFGHDLGLPDLYDTSGNTGGAENSTGFWTLYSSGSYGSSGRRADGIGTKPIPMSAYEKLFLGWSNFLAVDPTKRTRVKMGPAAYNTKGTQQLVVPLPDKEVTTDIGDPYAGSYFYHSGAGNNLDNMMTRSVTLPAGTVQLSAKTRYEIEENYDFAFLTVNGQAVATNLSSTTQGNPAGGITGTSNGAWVDLTADLTAFAGQTVTLGFRYITDPAVADAGFGVDNIAITGLPMDGGETDAGWTYNGFTRTTGKVTQSYFNAYLAEYRIYDGYDKGLKTGPYNFGWVSTKPNWVEHFPYQDGLLVWYYDTSFPDNNVGDNCASGRCGGLVLPVDAHPDLLLRPDGKVWRPRIQSYDSTFGLERTDRIRLHQDGVARRYGGLRANPLFDDTVAYWRAPDASTGNKGWSSVPTPKTGTTIRVNKVSRDGDFMTVTVRPKAKSHR